LQLESAAQASSSAQQLPRSHSSHGVPPRKLPAPEEEHDPARDKRIQQALYFALIHVKGASHCGRRVGRSARDSTAEETADRLLGGPSHRKRLLGSRSRQGSARPTTRELDAELPLPFGDCSFDLVWCTEVVEHLSDPSSTLDEVRRVLRPGGALLLTTPNLLCPDDLARMLPGTRLYGFNPLQRSHGRPAAVSAVSPTIVVHYRKPHD
jgi:SAM-dependent methyltransferase